MCMGITNTKSDTEFVNKEKIGVKAEYKVLR